MNNLLTQLKIRFILLLPRWLKEILRPFANAYQQLKITCRDIKHYIRIQKPIVKIFGREWNTNLNIIDLIITYDCNLKCYDCNLACGKAPSREQLSLDQIKRFIKESVENDKKWNRISVLGGEPLIHPDFLEILYLLIDYKTTYSPDTTIRVLTNGYGPQVNSMLAKIPPGIQINNTHKTSPINKRFICFTNAPIDCRGYKNVDFSCGCFRLSQCGISLNKYGYYPCSVAGTIDRIFGFNNGLKKLPTKTGYEIAKSLELFCKHCGGFLYSGHKKPTGYTSPAWKGQLQSYQKVKPKLTQC